MPTSRRRLKSLEMLIGHDPACRAEEAARQRQERGRLALLQFLEQIPLDCRDKVRDHLTQSVVHDGLHQLFSCMQNGTWIAQPIPPEVVQVFLNDPKAEPYQRCLECQLLLPLRWGIWRNTQTKLWWQAPLRYFASCPACGGTIGKRHDGTQYVFPRIPYRVEPPWEFVDDALR